MGDSSLCKANAFDPKVTNSALCRNELVSKTRQRRNNVWKQSAITFSTSSRTWSAEAKTLQQTKTKMEQCRLLNLFNANSKLNGFWEVPVFDQIRANSALCNVQE